MASWEELQKIAADQIINLSLGPEYADRLKFEIEEINRQGAGATWEKYHSSGKRFDNNPNRLLLPWLLGLLASDEDPFGGKCPTINTTKVAKIIEYEKLNGKLPPGIVRDPDMPDIDLDCLPKARDPIKQYAMDRYSQTNEDDEEDSYGSVCSVGTWQTYKFRSALIDVCAATGLVDKPTAYELTTNLPDNVDDLKDNGYAVCKGLIRNDLGEEKECGTSHNQSQCPSCGSPDTDSPTIGQLMAENDNLALFNENHPEIIEYAVRIIGRFRNMGMHAGALIIANCPLYGNIPLAKSTSKGYYISMWSEGRNTTLSKFGFVKFDILGLKTLEYTRNCCMLIERNRGIKFGRNAKNVLITFKDGSTRYFSLDETIQTDKGPILVQELYQKFA